MINTKTYPVSGEDLASLADLICWFDGTPAAKNHRDFISHCHRIIERALGDDAGQVYHQACEVYRPHASERKAA